MTQTSNRLFDDLAKLMNDAAGAAQGVKQEFETMARSQGEKILPRDGCRSTRGV